MKKLLFRFFGRSDESFLLIDWGFSTQVSNKERTVYTFESEKEMEKYVDTYFSKNDQRSLRTYKLYGRKDF